MRARAAARIDDAPTPYPLPPTPPHTRRQLEGELQAAGGRWEARRAQAAEAAADEVRRRLGGLGPGPGGGELQQRLQQRLRDLCTNAAFTPPLAKPAKVVGAGRAVRTYVQPSCARRARGGEGREVGVGAGGWSGRSQAAATPGERLIACSP